MKREVWVIGLFCSIPLAAAGLTGCCPSVLYEIATPEPTVRLPHDEAPHGCGGVEWWYYTGRVVADDGRGYGIEAVIFHVPRWPLSPPAEIWVAHYAVLDEARECFVYDQVNLPRLAPGDRPPPGGFDLQTALVQMTGVAGRDHLRAGMSDGRYALDLTLNDERGAVLHGDGGYVAYGSHGSSFYYSRPRMRAVGTLRIDGRPQRVSGHLWFDRQWGRSLRNPWLSWEWFSLRLDDGTDVMLFVFRDQTPSATVGTYIRADGESFPLTRDEFVVTPTAWWTSPHTEITYPVGWNIHIIPAELDLSVTAVADDQELDVRATTFNVYWEGLSTIAGTHAGQPVGGHAYVELANY